MTHELKTFSKPFIAVATCEKTHEVRRADRQYNVGDVLHLREWDQMMNVYTGRAVMVAVTYVTRPCEHGLPDDVCVMSIKLID